MPTPSVVFQLQSDPKAANIVSRVPVPADKDQNHATEAAPAIDQVPVDKDENHATKTAPAKAQADDCTLFK